MTQELPEKPELIPAEPMPECAEAFSARVHGLMDGKPKDDCTVHRSLAGFDEMFERIAAGMYSLASMLVGEGEDSVRLVETSIDNVQLSPGESAAQARQSNRRAMAGAAIRLLEERTPGCLAVSVDAGPSGGCLGDDELDAAGVSREELDGMLAGPDRERVRTWLGGLSTPTRVVFVLRAVAGFTSAEIATLLTEQGLPGWTSDSVREQFRQGLCSLASQLIHAALE